MQGMIKPLILVTAPVQTRSGYGNHARDICRALIESDKYDIAIQSVPWGNTPLNALEKDNPVHKEIEKRILRQPQLPKQPELHLHIVIPNEFKQFGKKNIGMTAGIESTIPPADWIEGCNRMDKVIFTSEFSKKGFTDIKFDKLDKNTKQKVGEVRLERPSEVLFEGADANVYKETNQFSDRMTNEFSKINEDFCYLFVGHWLQGNLGEDRKDIGMMIKTFLLSFKDMKSPPALVLKTSGASFSVMDRVDMEKKINQIKDTVKADKLPNIYLIHGDLTDDEMNEMYNHPKVKAHLTFTHGEGFGRPLLEASFSGRPIIAPISTGQADFLDKEYTIEIPHVMTKVAPNAFPKEYVTPDSQWSTVKYSVASALMRDVFKNYNKYKIRGKKQMIVNRENFSYEAMKSKLIDMVEGMMTEIPKMVELKLPTLKKEPTKLKLPKLKKG
jgi:glycosyltransferase involved in cell wall biosynthesis|tara:strand:- start:223 stop:1551 length:1329 start_codon:yes stop_codon:yes gene_type:complete